MDTLARTLVGKISSLTAKSGPLLVAIDGRCASGKSTLAARLGELLDCPVFHMDDYFPRPEQRTAQRLSTPGGNIDYERFLTEILVPLRSGAGEITYRPLDCATLSLLPPISVKAGRINIIEGSYSCHPALLSNYDLRIFLTTSPEEQLRRIALRNGEEKLRQFRERWIPMEELYFTACDVAGHCDLIYTT